MSDGQYQINAIRSRVNDEAPAPKLSALKVAGESLVARLDDLKTVISLLETRLDSVLSDPIQSNAGQGVAGVNSQPRLTMARGLARFSNQLSEQTDRIHVILDRLEL